MLTHLSIKNIVLIEACELAFDSGLCVLTGETGAGKSILLDALGLALGARGDAQLVRRGEESGSVSAEFDISNNAAAKAALEALELPVENTLIIRRSISTDGKTRCLVNDQPVSVAGLKKLGEALVEVNGQHDSRGLLDVATHRGLLDEFGGHGAILGKVRAAHEAWREAGTKLAQLKEAAEQSAREQEYLRHMAYELKELDPKPGEEAELAEKRSTMMQSEKLFEVINGALAELNAGKGAAGALRGAQRLLARSALNAGNRFSAAINTLDRAATEADEAVNAMETLAQEAVYDPAKLEAMEERLFALKAAARKYNLSVDELAGLRAEAETRLALIDSRDSEMAKLEKTEKEAKAAYEAQAAELAKKRAVAAKKLEKAVEAELEPLKMGSARFAVKLEKLAEAAWSAKGWDSVTFAAATNVAKKGEVHFAPLAKIASGGELARFMLAMKVALSEVRSTPTLVFDEIDIGTGGAVADAIGARLRLLGAAAQVLVVTHLPQVAARGHQHLRVAKAEGKDKVLTSVVNLDAAARREELARMLAGSEVTAEARQAAKKLLEQAA